MDTKKDREYLIIQKEGKYGLLPLNDVVLFKMENRYVYALDKDNNKVYCSRNLADVEARVGNRQFFRANRQYLINFHYMRSFQSWQRVKLLLEMQAAGEIHKIVISQSSNAIFKAWLNEK